MIIDNDIASIYPVRFSWMGEKPRRGLELRVRDEDFPQRYAAYYSGGDWWEEKDAMMAWCSKTFGHRNNGYNNPRWSQHAFEFRFKYEKDAVFFILKWG